MHRRGRRPVVLAAGRPGDRPGPAPLINPWPAPGGGARLDLGAGTGDDESFEFHLHWGSLVRRGSHLRFDFQLPREGVMRYPGIVLTVGALVVSACGGGDGGGGPSPASLTMAKGPVSGDNQSATVGQTLPQPVQVIVRRDGVAEAGALVSWATLAAGGSLTPATSTTDASGLAVSTWTLGTTPGSQIATASVTGSTGSPLSFMATAQHAASAVLGVAVGNNQSGPTDAALPNPLVVKVTDTFGNPVAGTVVSWAVTGGSGTVSPATSTSAVSGTAITHLTLGSTAGMVTVQATSTGLTGSPATFSATAVVASPDRVQVMNNQFLPATITVPVNSTVTWIWAQGSLQHNIVPDNQSNVPSSPQVVNGPFIFSHTFTTPGTYNYHCAVHGGPGTGMHGTVIVQ